MRKWVLPVNHPLSYPCAMSKEILLFAGAMASKHRQVSLTLTKFYRYVTGVPLLLVVVGCVISSLAMFNAAGALMTIRSLVVLPLGACIVGSSFSQRATSASVSCRWYCVS